MQHGVDVFWPGCESWAQPAYEQLPHLARAPMRLLAFAADNQRLLALAADNQALDLRRQLVGITDRSPTAVAQRFKAGLLVVI